MQVLILANGVPPSKKMIMKYAKNADLIICCDGACSYARKYDFLPNIIVGDMDSLKGGIPEKYKGIETHRYSSVKDKTDTEIAIELALEKGCTAIDILGATGKRTDHMLGNMQLLLLLAKKNIDAYIIDNYNSITAFTGEIEQKGKIGETLSLIPFSEGVLAEATEGLKYPLKNTVLPLDRPLGISNVFISKNIKIKISNGYALLIRVNSKRL